MEVDKGNTKRIAYNTIILYIRMIIVMVISLYTSRIVLKALGFEDFGLYNVIGGIVGLFAFFRTSMEKATQRFLNVEMARPEGNLNEVFCVNLSIHLLISLVILVLAETVGLWFLNTYINIPEGREVAANWVYQSVILSLCMTVVGVPYSACVIAHEKMSFYALVSITDAVLKLLIAFAIAKSDGDRLILYGCLMAGISFVNLLMYFVFCRKKYLETKFHLVLDKSRYKTVFGFIGWTLLGQGAIVGTSQGTNILVNMFHGVTANAAMSIGNQVNHAIVNLSSNFQSAFNPQITKSYAAKNYDYLLFLICTTSKISFFLLFIVSLPVTFNIDWILSVWLGEVPPQANMFCILCIANGILNALSAPLNFTVMASGRIKYFQIVTAVVYLSDLLIVYAFFELGFPAYVAMAVKVVIMVFVLAVRLYFANRELPILNFGIYFKRVLLPIGASAVLAIIIAWLMMHFANTNTAKVFATICFTLISMLLAVFIAMTKKERISLKGLVVKKKK